VLSYGIFLSVIVMNITCYAVKLTYCQEYNVLCRKTHILSGI